MEKILVVTATYNEKENIEKLIYEIFRSKKNVDVFVIDDNSPDGTGEILKKISKENNNFYYKIRSGKLGLNTAHILGYNYGTSEWYKITYSLFNKNYKTRAIKKNKNKSSIINKFKSLFDSDE